MLNNNESITKYFSRPEVLHNDLNVAKMELPTISTNLVTWCYKLSVSICF